MPGEWINDGHGIPLVVICHRATCRRLALGGFRADILTSYEADEPIEPEDEISPTPGWVTDPNFGSNLE
jgi:hypothetical protein